MLVREVMTSPAITVQSVATVKDAMRLLDEHHVTALPVVDHDGRLVGIVSEADLLREAVREDERTHLIPHEHLTSGGPRAIEDVMSTLSMSVRADSDLKDAVELMTSTAVKSLPVVENGHVIGVVSRSDVVHVLARSDDSIHAEVDELLRSAGLDCEVEVEDGHVLVEGPVDPHQRRIAEVIAGSVTGVVSVRVRG
jgi:CBS-domain-containing membrane protein